jgi:hypothetical protein
MRKWLVLVFIFMLFSSAVYAQDMSATVGSTFLLRSLERLIVVFFGGLSLVLGYRLFHLTTQSASEIQAKGGGYDVKVSQVAPGIFFAFFGASVLIYALYLGPELSKEGNPEGDIRIRGATADFTVSPENSRSFIITLNSLEESISGYGTFPDPQRKKFVGNLLTDLESLKRILTDSALGEPDRYIEWKKLDNLQKTDPASFANKMMNKETERRFNDAQSLLTETRAQ